MNIPQDAIDDLKDSLEAELHALEAELAAHGSQEPDGTWTGNESETGEEADPTDTADNIEELITNVPLVEGFEARKKDIVDALAKMDAGTYGTCEVGNEPIPLERLEANPAARTCVKHAGDR